jgi:hypothetical protein
LEGIVRTRLDDAILGNAFKRVVAEIEQEMVVFVSDLRTYRTPISSAIRARRITRNPIKLSPFWCNLTETALALVPTFIVS